MLGKIEDKWRRGWQRMRWLDDITDSMDMNFSVSNVQTPEDSEGQGSPACCSPWGRKESDMTEQPNSSNNSSLPAYLPHSLCSIPGTKST